MIRRTAHKLEFINSDATPKTTTIICNRASVPHIMAWYGAYHAGDRYRVTLDGVKVEKDYNGAMKEPRAMIPREK